MDSREAVDDGGAAEVPPAAKSGAAAAESSAATATKSGAAAGSDAARAELEEALRAHDILVARNLNTDATRSAEVAFLPAGRIERLALIVEIAKTFGVKPREMTHDGVLLGDRAARRGTSLRHVHSFERDHVYAFC